MRLCISFVEFQPHQSVMSRGQYLLPLPSFDDSSSIEPPSLLLFDAFIDGYVRPPQTHVRYTHTHTTTRALLLLWRFASFSLVIITTATAAAEAKVRTVQTNVREGEYKRWRWGISTPGYTQFLSIKRFSYRHAFLCVHRSSNQRVPIRPIKIG